ncbi:MAG: hypothetical protein M9935_09105 [Kiritimatiellae bacterium]|nr:hypothetical protein [Kiritimatiellia bacterium]
MKHWSAFSWIAVLALGLSACGRDAEPTMRRYREIATSASAHAGHDHGDSGGAAPMRNAPGGMSDMAAPGAPAVTAANEPVAWTTPEGWTEQLGNPMRIATFIVGAERVECTLTAFPGAVGGIEENLQRWARQINLQVAPDTLAKFARSPNTFKTEGDFPCLTYDFTSLAPDADPSILAAILPLEDRTLFVKLTGPRTLLEEQKEAFTALCRSLRP